MVNEGKTEMNAYYEDLRNSLIQAQRAGDVELAEYYQSLLDRIGEQVVNEFTASWFDDEDGTIPS